MSELKTTAEERAKRKEFWGTIPHHEPEPVARFEEHLLADVDALIAERVALREAAQFKRNVILTPEWLQEFAGDWIAVPREDFDKLRALLAEEKA